MLRLGPAIPTRAWLLCEPLEYTSCVSHVPRSRKPQTLRPDSTIHPPPNETVRRHAGLGALALAGKRSDATMSDDKLKVATGLLVVNAAYFGWRALKSKKDDDVVTKVAQKTGWGN